MPTNEQLHSFAERYTTAWNRRNPASVAACYAPDGWLEVNDDPPRLGGMPSQRWRAGS